MTYEVYLAHRGVKGQKWGVQRYQNADGTLTDAGQKRYMKKAEKLSGDYEKRKERSAKKANKSLEKASKFFEEGLKDLSSKGLSSSDFKRFSDLGTKILERKDLQDRFSKGEESAFWEIYGEQLAYGQKKK